MLHQAQSKEVGVIYPSVRQPFQKIFTDIYDGINAGAGTTLPMLEIDDKSTAKDLDQWRKRNNVSQLIVLGNRSGKFVEAASLPFRKISYGAVRDVNLKPSESAVSIIPAPKSTLSQLLGIAPKVKRVFIIEQKASNGPLLKNIEMIGKGLGLEIVINQVDSPQSFAKALKTTIKSMQPKQDAFWLSHNSSPINKSLLRQTLVDAWNNNLIIFSSNLADVKRGALFAVFPDNVLMGKQLYELSKNSSKTQEKLQYVQNLHVAFNRRTASHLGLNFSKNEMKLFKLVYPPN